MSEALSFTVRLEQQEKFQFLVKFDLEGVPDLLVDEPRPLGESDGPNAVRMLAASVGNCLAASLLFCLRKFKQTPGNIVAQVVGHLGREAHGRLRVQALDVTVHLGDATEPLTRLAHCLKEFEEYCVVTQSVRQGIQVNVRVEDAMGRVLFDRAHGVDTGEPSGPMLQLEHDPSFSQ